jgi:competence protein ComGC
MSETSPPVSGNPSVPKTSALAVWSLVLGILSLVICLFAILAAIPGVICGHMALSRIKASGGALAGQGLAIAGLITGYLGILLGLIAIPMVLAIAIPNFVKARETVQMNVCLSNLRQIDAAKQQWALDNKKQATDIPTESDLAPYLKGVATLKCPAGGTYQINAVGEKPTCSNPKHKLE